MLLLILSSNFKIWEKKTISSREMRIFWCFDWLGLFWNPSNLAQSVFTMEILQFLNIFKVFPVQ